MSGLKGRGLQIDDPLGPGPSPQEREAAVQRGTDHTVPPHEHGAAERSGDESMEWVRPAPRSGRRTAAPATGRSSAASRKPSGAAGDRADTDGRAWREWTGLTGVGSFRLPHELLAELGDTARERQLPIGMIVTAAITQLLDQPSDTIAALVDRADDARIQGRRRARRRLTTRSDD